MAIFVIDQGPELFWFVSTILVQYDLPLKHIQNTQLAEQFILQESPELVIISGDDKTLAAETFIHKIRNDIFSKNVPFLVITANTAFDFKKSLMKAGAGQILYRNKENILQREQFLSAIKWLMTKEKPDPYLFSSEKVSFPTSAELISFNRLGWVTETHCLIESNLNIEVGQSVKINSPFFDELELEEVQLHCISKNTTGSYHFHKNSIIFEISSRFKNKDGKKIKAWIENNKDLSKPKPIKIVYFENETAQQEKILSMVRRDGSFYLRGYQDIQNANEVLNSQVPHLILLNRDLMWDEPRQVEFLSKFIQNNFCYCVTYSNNNFSDINEFKKKYPFAMHSKSMIDQGILDTMIEMLRTKLPEKLQPENGKFYFDKSSPYSFLNLISNCNIKEMSPECLEIELPISIEDFSLCEISSHAFSRMGINRIQQLRSFVNIPSSEDPTKNNCRFIFIGQHQRDFDLIKKSLELVKQDGFEAWLKS